MANTDVSEWNDDPVLRQDVVRAVRNGADSSASGVYHAERRENGDIVVYQAIECIEGE